MITQDLMTFIHKNDGHLPKNKQEFAPYVNSIGLLDSFRIEYGIQLNELHEKHGKLYDREGNQVLLIKGNTNIPFIRKKYEECSLEVFRKENQRKSDTDIENLKN